MKQESSQKLDPALDYTDKTAILKALETSVENLGVKSIFGLMLHKENLLDLWKEGLGKNSYGYR